MPMAVSIRYVELLFNYHLAMLIENMRTAYRSCRSHEFANAPDARLGPVFRGLNRELASGFTMDFWDKGSIS
jgi:hypothetical protein